MEGVQIVGPRILCSDHPTDQCGLCLLYMSYPDCYQLETIYSAYLIAVCWAALGGHPVWSNTGKEPTLATSMVSLYSEVNLVRNSHD